MKNYPQWDRMDDFLKQHRGPKKASSPRWGRRVVAMAILVVLALILAGVFGHSHSSSTPINPTLPSSPSQNALSTQTPGSTGLTGVSQNASSTLTTAQASLPPAPVFSSQAALPTRTAPRATPSSTASHSHADIVSIPLPNPVTA
jgi:cytoskeletal protein RodZ